MVRVQIPSRENKHLLDQKYNSNTVGILFQLAILHASSFSLYLLIYYKQLCQFLNCALPIVIIICVLYEIRVVRI